MSQKQSREYKRNFMREYRKKNPEKMKAIDLKKKYGLSLEDYYKILQEQNYVCAICKNPEFACDHRTGLPRALAVDHNHLTGRVRGLLCTNCNKAIGHLKDDPNLAKICAEYLTTP